MLMLRINLINLNPRWITLIILSSLLILHCKTVSATPGEICEDESAVNLEYCPMRPGIQSKFLDLHKFSYFVCEEDFLPQCAESITLEDKKPSFVAGPNSKGSNSSAGGGNTQETTTMKLPVVTTPTPATTASSSCSHCQTICDEHRERCDLSENLQNSSTMFAGVLRVREGQAQAQDRVHAQIDARNQAPAQTEAHKAAGITPCDEDIGHCDFSLNVQTSTSTISGELKVQNDHSDAQKQTHNTSTQSQDQTIKALENSKDLTLETGQYSKDETWRNHDSAFSGDNFASDQYTNDKNGRNGNGNGIQNMTENLNLGSDQYSKDKYRKNGFQDNTSGRNQVSKDKDWRTRFEYLSPIIEGDGGSDNYPRVYFDVFRERKPMERPKNEIETILDQFTYLGADEESVGIRNRQNRRRRRRELPRRRMRYVPPSEAAPSYYNYNNNGRVDSISPSDEEKLMKLYGTDTYGYHKDQFLQVANMPGAHQESVHIPKPIPVDPDYLREEMDKVRLQSLEMNSGSNEHEHADLTKITQPMVNKMIRNLLVRLEMLEMNPLAAPSTLVTEHCSVQGLWISTVKGVAIHLEPMSANMLKLRVIDFPNAKMQRGGTTEFETRPFVTSDWVGTAHLSSEAPTTISIILQEKLTVEKKPPKTAVFVGQCLVCNGLTAIQGTWTVFPENPVCFKDPDKSPQVDLMYLL